MVIRIGSFVVVLGLFALLAQGITAPEAKPGRCGVD